MLQSTLVQLRRLMLLIADIVLINVALFAALYFRFDGNVPMDFQNIFLRTFIPLTVIQIVIYAIFNLYRSLWKYASIDEIFQVFFATLSGAGACFLYGILMKQMLPRTVYAIWWILALFLVGGIRFCYRIGRRVKNLPANHSDGIRRAMIVGAGEAGSIVIKELLRRNDLNVVPVIIVDDDREKIGAQIHGIPVKGDRNQIPELADKFNVDEIIVTISATNLKNKEQLREIYRICTTTHCKLKTLPGLYEMMDKDNNLNGSIDVKKLRDINIEDLLGREEIRLNTEEISGYLQGETVLVTGGGGSIGSELCRQIAKFNPKKLLIFDIYENNAYDLINELNYTYGKELDVEVLIGSVRDKARLEYVFSTYQPGIVFHAAAHKHVPLMEANPTEAIKNNIFGTMNTAECADQFGAKKFVLISTDKAVNPTNIMGASKRVAEMIIQNLNKNSNTEFVAVRFGNVLGSNGSVIPLFQKQIARGGPVTVTHKDITRFFMTIPEAARLVIQAGAMARGGEIFILDMGEPVKIVHLAEDLIRLSGYDPYQDIQIEFTGLRPGEKLYEELMLKEEGLTATRHEKIFVSKPVNMDYKLLAREINSLKNVLNTSAESIVPCIERLVPTYCKVG